MAFPKDEEGRLLASIVVCSWRKAGEGGFDSGQSAGGLVGWRLANRSGYRLRFIRG